MATLKLTTRRTDNRAQHPTNRHRNPRRMKLTSNLQYVDVFNRHVRYASGRPVLIQRLLVLNTSRLVGNLRGSINDLMHHVVNDCYNAVQDSKFDL